MPKPVAADIDKHIGTRLQKLRQKEGVSAAALAEAIGSTQQQISRYENGQNKLSASQLYRVADCLGVPVAWFFQDLGDTGLKLLVKEPDAGYLHSQLQQELETLKVLWPKLHPAQRSALLKLLDTFLVQS